MEVKQPTRWATKLALKRKALSPLQSKIRVRLEKKLVNGGSTHDFVEWPKPTIGSNSHIPGVVNMWYCNQENGANVSWESDNQTTAASRVGSTRPILSEELILAHAGVDLV